eukprot:SAG22_NODE_617_length_8527_cov_70.297342_1_plen_443_part_10
MQQVNGGHMKPGESLDFYAFVQKIMRSVHSEDGTTINMDKSALKKSTDHDGNSEQFLRRKVKENWKALCIDFNHVADKTGDMKPEVLRKVIYRYNIVPSDSMWRDVCKQMDADGDGLISYNEFMAEPVTVSRHAGAAEIQVQIGGKPFTSLIWPDDIMKPTLWPIYGADGTTLITRGFPSAPRQGERVDHPHHVGLWFNFGNVNGLDFVRPAPPPPPPPATATAAAAAAALPVSLSRPFAFRCRPARLPTRSPLTTAAAARHPRTTGTPRQWNNSPAIKTEERGKYGEIRLKEVLQAEGGAAAGRIKTRSDWVGPDGTTLLAETTEYTFSGTATTRTVDRVTTLAAKDAAVLFKDDKEGTLGLRVCRELEYPDTAGGEFTDSNGVITTLEQMDTTGVTGLYRSSEGKVGDDVWATRADWVTLAGEVGPANPVAVTIFDHPANP